MADENKKTNKPIHETDQFERWSAELENFESIPERPGRPNENNSFLLGAVLNYLPNPFYVIDVSDYTIKAANSAAQFASKSKDSTCYALTHQKDRPCGSAAHPCPLEIIKETKKPLTVEHLHYDQDGNPRNVEVHAFPIFDRQENVSHIIEYVLDITERVKAENALKWELRVNSALSKMYKPMISPEVSIETIAGMLLEQAKALTDSKQGYVFSINPNNEKNDATNTHDKMGQGEVEIPDEIRMTFLPKEFPRHLHMLWKYSFNTQDFFYTNSPAEHPAFKTIPEEPLTINRFLSVPVLLGKDFVGWIALANKDSDYLERDLNAIRRLSEYYALFIQRKKAEIKLQKAHSELEKRVEERTSELKKSYEERALIQEIFGAYMSYDVAAEILNSPGGIKLGGEMREMTILVSDLRGFSDITESMEASRVLKLINRYLEQMIPVIIRHEGTIDEFTGDGILTFFGAPRSITDHVSRAVSCALEMQASMLELNRENHRLGLPKLGMGIGITTGKLVVGNIGSERRMKYGAVGSPINRAFRLEGKARPGEVLVTEEIKKELADSLQVGWQWKDRFKGMGEEMIYQVIGMRKG